MFTIIAAPASTRDAGTVRLGGYSPSLPMACPASVGVAVKDNGQVRIGGYGPSSLAAAPAATRDAGQVRIGGYSPAF
jgi:hypothetical protein